MAEMAGIQVTPHISSGYSYVYVLHFASYIPNIGAYQEHKAGFKETCELFTPQLRLKDGAINVPTGPGLGMNLEPSLLNKAYLIK